MATLNMSDYMDECPAGWCPLVNKLFSDIGEVLSKSPEGTLFKVVQIKSKFGELRFYYDIETDCEETREVIKEIVDKASIASQSVCENCGEAGELVKSKGWLSISCVRCANDW